MIQVQMDKEDILSLVMGTDPDYSKINDFEKRNLGRFSGSYDRWTWNNHSLDKLTETELYDLYRETKDSWN